MNNIKSARLAKGFSQKEFAQMVGIAASTLSQWETSTREPDWESMKKISALLDVSIDYLLENEKKPVQQSELDNKLFDLVDKLTEDEIKEVDKFIDYLISKRKKD